MKRIAATALILAFALSIAACNNKTPSPSSTPDGTYTATVTDEYASTTGHSWKDMLTVTYKDGKITRAEFDSVHLETGARKSSVSPEDYPMELPPTTWIPQLNANIVEGGSSASIDTVSGATSSSSMVRYLLDAIEREGKPGETIEVEVK